MPSSCRSELAREELESAAFIQEARIIVDVLREQARSYKKWHSDKFGSVAELGGLEVHAVRALGNAQLAHVAVFQRDLLGLGRQ